MVEEKHHNYLLLPCTLGDSNGRRIKTKAFLSYRCTTTSLIDPDVYAKYNLITHLLQTPRKLITTNGTESIGGLITHGITLTLRIGSHTKIVHAFVTKLGKYDFILGLPWLEKHNPSVDWSLKAITFDKQYCQSNCLEHHCSQSTVKHLRERISIIDPKYNTPGKPRKVGAAAFLLLANQKEVQVFNASIHKIDVELHKKGYQNLLADKKCHQCTTDDISLDCAGATLKDIQIALNLKPNTDPREKLSPHLHPFLKLFDAEEASILPDHWPCNHRIELKPGTTPPSRPCTVCQKMSSWYLGSFWTRT